MPWLGLDDTDTLEGGCTTHEFHRLLLLLGQQSIEGAPWSLPADPVLVRLWPFAPQRTRGNAALACRIETEDEPALHRFLETWFAGIESRTSEPISSIDSAQPCLTYSRSIEPDFYWRAVRRFVPLRSAEEYAAGLDGFRCWTTARGRSGLVGSLAAMCWNGEHDHTWELTAYREQVLIGSERMLDALSVEQMTNEVSGTFLNRDPNSGDSLITPRTPCPVLYGIRGESSDSTLLAHELLQSNTKNEKCDSYQIWRTNQATGDHIDRAGEGVTITAPDELKGGHASVEVQQIGESTDRLRLMAFKQGGAVNDLLRATRPGDRISWLGLASPDGSIHLERIRFVQTRIAGRCRPACKCGGHLKSAGANQALRCDACRSLNPRLWLNSRSDCTADWVEPEAKQRRHLALPLARRSENLYG